VHDYNYTMLHACTAQLQGLCTEARVSQDDYASPLPVKNILVNIPTNSFNCIHWSLEFSTFAYIIYRLSSTSNFSIFIPSEAFSCGNKICFCRFQHSNTHSLQSETTRRKFKTVLFKH